MESHFRSSAFVLNLIFTLPGLLATLPCASAPSQQSAVSASSVAALESRAEAGDAVAQYDLAVEHLRSNPAAPDYKSAIKWLSASAAQGNVDAEFLLGYLYEHGEGTERNYAKAAGNYQAAAGKGSRGSGKQSGLLVSPWHGRTEGLPQSPGIVFSRGTGRRSCRSIESCADVLPR